MAPSRPAPPTVTIPDGCRDDVVPLSDPRAEPLASAGVTQVALSSLVAGFDWPGPDPHTHLVLATIEGRGCLDVDGRERELVPGTVAVCPARTPRRQWANEPWLLVTIRLAEVHPWHPFRAIGPFVLEEQDPHRLAAPVLGMLSELPPATTVVSGASRGRDPVDEFLDRFGAKLSLDPRGRGPVALTEPFSLYAVILRIQLDALCTGPPQVSDDERRLTGLWEVVRRAPERPWTVESLARQVCVSRATLHRLVTRHHRSSPGAIVERIRMDRAANLLLQSGLPIKAIASQVGYSTPYSFSAAFRRAQGVAPSAYRERAGRRSDD